MMGNSALDHIHNIVKDDAYKRGYEDGRKDTIPLDWIRGYIDRLKDMGVAIALRDAQAVSVMVDKYMMERYGNETCGSDYCEIGGNNEQA
jgi:hypothetical protein